MSEAVARRRERAENLSVDVGDEFSLILFGATLLFDSCDPAVSVGGSLSRRGRLLHRIGRILVRCKRISLSDGGLLPCLCGRPVDATQSEQGDNSRHHGDSHREIVGPVELVAQRPADVHVRRPCRSVSFP